MVKYNSNKVWKTKLNLKLEWQFAMARSLTWLRLTSENFHHPNFSTLRQPIYSGHFDYVLPAKPSQFKTYMTSIAAIKWKFCRWIHGRVRNFHNWLEDIWKIANIGYGGCVHLSYRDKFEVIELLYLDYYIRLRQITEISIVNFTLY